MVLQWTIAVLASVSAAILCIRAWRRWQAKAEATRIVRAIECGDTDELLLLWAEKAHPAAVRDWFGEPALIVAARRCPAAARLLLSRGVSIDDRGVNWMTALMHAAAAGDVELCRQLLAFGADRDARDAFGRPAAWWAESAGHDRLAALLRADAGDEVR